MQVKNLLLTTVVVLISTGVSNTAYSQSPGSNNSVVVTNERVKNTFELIAHNKNPWSVTLSLDIDGVN